MASGNLTTSTIARVFCELPRNLDSYRTPSLNIMGDSRDRVRNTA